MQQEAEENGKKTEERVEDIEVKTKRKSKGSKAKPTKKRSKIIIFIKYNLYIFINITGYYLFFFFRVHFEYLSSIEEE